MARFTATDRKKFNSGQLAELDKLSAARLAEYVTTTPENFLGPDGQVAPGADYKVFMIKKLAKKSAAQLRARVNLVSISWGTDGPAIKWATSAQGGDYTDAEKASIQDLLKPGGKYEDVAVRVAGGERSVEQRLAAGGL
tara:strand:+ start:6507 stop:6923 length:417 start_codon:yes stop_codon:yes gene_type:complete